MTTKRETYELLKKVALFYDQFEVNPEKVELWHNVLRNYSFEHIEQQLFTYVKDGHYPPKLVDLIPKSAIPRTDETKIIITSGIGLVNQEVVQQELANMRKILGIKR